MKDIFLLIFTVLGVPLLVFAQVTGIGVFLYQWGVEDVTLGLAAWTGFKYWISMMVTGVVSILIAIGLNS